jgi:hypothetical protein
MVGVRAFDSLGFKVKDITSGSSPPMLWMIGGVGAM